jgi:hypothetical protein
VRCVRVTCAGGGGSSSSFGSSANTPKLAPCASMPNLQPLRALARRMPCGAAACSPTRALRLGRRKREWGLSGNGALVGMGLRSQPRGGSLPPAPSLGRSGSSRLRSSIFSLSAGSQQRRVDDATHCNTLQHVANLQFGAASQRFAAQLLAAQCDSTCKTTTCSISSMGACSAHARPRIHAQAHACMRARATNNAPARAHSRMCARALGCPPGSACRCARLSRGSDLIRPTVASVAQIRELPAKVGRAMRARAAADSVRRSAGKARRGPRAP